MFTKSDDLTRFCTEDMTRTNLLRPWFGLHDGEAVVWATNGHYLARKALRHPDAKAFAGYYVPKSLSVALKVKGAVDVILSLADGRWTVEARGKKGEALSTLTEPAEPADRVPDVTHVLPKPEAQCQAVVGMSGEYLADIAAHGKLVHKGAGLQFRLGKNVLDPIEVSVPGLDTGDLKVILMPMRVERDNPTLLDDGSGKISEMSAQIETLRKQIWVLEAELRAARASRAA